MQSGDPQQVDAQMNSFYPLGWTRGAAQYSDQERQVTINLGIGHLVWSLDRMVGQCGASYGRQGAAKAGKYCPELRGSIQ
jgi:hypothetical protein